MCVYENRDDWKKIPLVWLMPKAISIKFYWWYDINNLVGGNVSNDDDVMTKWSETDSKW